MKIQWLKKIFCIAAFALLSAPSVLQAADQRKIPLDIYLIIDTSEGLIPARSEIIGWVNDQVIDRLLQEGDRLVIWSAGPAAKIIYTETIGSTKDKAKNELLNLDVSGSSADFSAALSDAASRAARENPDRNRISYTILVSSSAENLAPSLDDSNSLFRWSRAEKYSRWQVLVADPNIDQRVRQAAASYMNSR